MMGGILTDMKIKKIVKFNRFWETCSDGDRNTIKAAAETWDDLHCTRYALPCEINALRAAGTLVHVYGTFPDGTALIDVANWCDFVSEVLIPIQNWAYTSGVLAF